MGLSSCSCASKLLLLWGKCGDSAEEAQKNFQPPHTLGCTWASQAYHRRPGVQTDGGESLRRHGGWVADTNLLAGELAQHRGDVTGILSHHPAHRLLHGARDAARHTGHDVLQLQQRQRRVPEGHHELLHPLLQLQRKHSVGQRPCRGGGTTTHHGAPNTLDWCRPHMLEWPMIWTQWSLEQSRMEWPPDHQGNTQFHHPECPTPPPCMQTANGVRGKRSHL